MDKSIPKGIFAKPLKSDPIDWQGSPIKVISLGCGDTAILDEKAISDISAADIIFGSEHHLREIENYPSVADKQTFPTPFSDLRNRIAKAENSKLVILASGDALFYGVGNWLCRLLGNSNLVFRPNISSIQYCFHAIGLPWQQAEIVSLHGRPLHSLRRHIKQNQLLAIFTDAKSNPTAIAKELCKQGYGDSDIWVCEAVGQAEENVDRYVISDLSNSEKEFNSLNVCIVNLGRNNFRNTWSTSNHLTPFPGIADEHFSTGAEPGFGMISKRETRLIILSMMSPENGEIAWDIGAGCGSVSVEWARWNNQGQIYAIEQSEERIDHIIENSERFGTSLNLTHIQGEAPGCCEALPQPDCIFVGGSNGISEMLEFAWQQLEEGGKLVASAVTDSSKQALWEFVEGKPGREWVELAVTKNLPNDTVNRSLKPVAIARCIKLPGKST